MRAALEGLGVDVAGFARAGVPDEARMREVLGPDARAFRGRDIVVSPSEHALSERPERIAEELVANVSDVVFEQLGVAAGVAEDGVAVGAQAA